MSASIPQLLPTIRSPTLVYTNHQLSKRQSPWCLGFVIRGDATCETVKPTSTQQPRVRNILEVSVSEGFPYFFLVNIPTSLALLQVTAPFRLIFLRAASASGGHASIKTTRSNCPPPPVQTWEYHRDASCIAVIIIHQRLTLLLFAKKTERVQPLTRAKIHSESQYLALIASNMEQYLKDLQVQMDNLAKKCQPTRGETKEDASQPCWRLVDYINVSAAPVCQHKRPSKPDPDPATWTVDNECHEYSLGLLLWNDRKLKVSSYSQSFLFSGSIFESSRVYPLLGTHTRGQFHVLAWHILVSSQACLWCALRRLRFQPTFLEVMFLLLEIWKLASSFLATPLRKRYGPLPQDFQRNLTPAVPNS